MLHDPDVFPDPDQFCPERWFSTGVPAFPMQAFGFGARLCPGRFFARRSIWETMAGILAAFDITPTEDGPRGCIRQGSYRESFTQDSYPKKWTKTKEESMVDT